MQSVSAYMLLDKANPLKYWHISCLILKTPWCVDIASEDQAQLVLI